MPCLGGLCGFSRIVQGPGYVSIYYEMGHSGGAYRTIPITTRPHLPSKVRLSGRKVLYAFDKRTGALLREFDMDGHSAAPPMTYLHAGTQYLVMAVGANEEAAIVAFGLPGR
jgi:hypothetical protein